MFPGWLTLLWAVRRNDQRLSGAALFAPGDFREGAAGQRFALTFDDPRRDRVALRTHSGRQILAGPGVAEFVGARPARRADAEHNGAPRHQMTHRRSPVAIMFHRFHPTRSSKRARTEVPKSRPRNVRRRSSPSPCRRSVFPIRFAARTSQISRRPARAWISRAEFCSRRVDPCQAGTCQALGFSAEFESRPGPAALSAGASAKRGSAVAVRRAKLRSRQSTSRRSRESAPSAPWKNRRRFRGACGNEPGTGAARSAPRRRRLSVRRSS